MKKALRSAGILALAVLLATTAAAGAVTLDSETTNTATTSDLTAASDTFAYNESASIYLEAQVETTTPAFELVDPETNETLAYLNGTELTQEYSDTSVSPAVYHYSATINQSVLSGVEMAADENKTLELRVINDETVTNPTVTTTKVFVHNDPKRTYLRIEDSEVGENGVATVATETTLGYQLPVVNQETATIDQSVPVNGSSTTATIDIANSTLSDRLSTSAEGASSGDWIVSTVATVDGNPAKVYMDKAPESAANETHLVYNSGSGTLDLVTGSNYSGQSADVVVNANYGTIKQYGVYGLDIFGGLSLPF